ncbi:MAG: hypothetical protein RMH81_08625 [Thermomicrobium sp.]|nr:hypothetical protein [Thermomicrobium sp.]
MVFQDPYFHALRHRLTATPYETYRRQFTARLRATVPPEPGPPHLAPAEIERREQWLYEKGLELYLPVLRTILRAIGREVEAGLIQPGELDPEELAFATYQRALEHLRRLPQLPRDRFAWLRHLARDTVHRAALARHSEHHRPTPAPSTTAPGAARVPPGPLARLAAALADADLPLPDDIVDDPDARRVLDQLLDRLPERWEAVYLLSALDRWTDDEIAAVTGLLPDEVRAIVHATARFLRAWIEELSQTAVEAEE